MYSCVRGQGIEAFRYGNVFDDPSWTFLTTARARSAPSTRPKAADAHRQGTIGASATLAAPWSKYQNQSGKSSHLWPAKTIYQDNPLSPRLTALPNAARVRPALPADHAPQLVFAQPPAALTEPQFVLPNDIAEPKNTLAAIIAADTVLQTLFSDSAFVLDFRGELLPWTPIAEDRRTQHTWRRVTRWCCTCAATCCRPTALKPSATRCTCSCCATQWWSTATSSVPSRNIFTYQLYANCLQPSARLGEGLPYSAI